ncbi:MAG: TetR/AcrR family transcriptional regulator [Rhodothermia bacterium]|nr:TetR/AcrR family transcriptional regulator [Rhodothermia bacterium]
MIEPIARPTVHASVPTDWTILIEAVADLYVEDPTHLTPETVCQRAGVDRDVFDHHFGSVNDAIRAWYPLAVDRVVEQMAEIPDLDRLPLQDRLGTFCFMLLDLLETRLDFVRPTYRYHAAGCGSPFHHRLRDALKVELSAADVPGVNYVVVDTEAARFVIAESIVQMIGVWLEDESPDRERATALIDRVLALLAEIMTNRVPQKTVDLVRYAVEAGYLPLDRVPFIGDLFRESKAEDG